MTCTILTGRVSRSQGKSRGRPWLASTWSGSPRKNSSRPVAIPLHTDPRSARAKAPTEYTGCWKMVTQARSAAHRRAVSGPRRAPAGRLRTGGPARALTRCGVARGGGTSRGAGPPTLEEILRSASPPACTGERGAEGGRSLPWALRSRRGGRRIAIGQPTDQAADREV